MTPSHSSQGKLDLHSSLSIEPAAQPQSDKIVHFSQYFTEKSIQIIPIQTLLLMVPGKYWWCNPPLEDYVRSLKTKVDVVVISRMFGQKIKEAEHGLGTIWERERERAEQHQSCISAGHWGGEGLTPPRSQERGRGVKSLNCEWDLTGRPGLGVVTARQSLCWFCIFAKWRISQDNQGIRS